MIVNEGIFPYQSGWEDQVEHVVKGLTAKQQSDLNHGEGLIAQILHCAVAHYCLHLLMHISCIA